ncbi:hypothetical protein Tsubulata_006172 [Turnera subulata]|uniref:Homeobox-leucine zipper protein n=1 Tax=Turnera subulata TaxID=218843 RepID=A0A9Q0FQI9_9ROSI|nr:hypothetical protein Tsubulata_006172 [Turnera subulata]
MPSEYREGGRESQVAGDDAKLETLPCLEAPQASNKKMKKSISNNNNRRFSDEQIKLLESIFESESKLEPRKKMQVARELGLQPRQVAIWFQNRRARWKSKQIEKDYKTLRANYDNLVSCFESLKNEKQSLLAQLQKLSEMMGLSSEDCRNSRDPEGGNTSTSSNYGNTNCETGAAGPGPENGRIGSSQDDVSIQMEHSAQQDHRELQGRGNYVDDSLESPETWYIFGSGGQFEQSSNSSYWLNFWS